MNKEELKKRTKKFALRVMSLASELPNNNEGWIVQRQIIRCSTSVASNYRASCRARSRLEFIAKLGIVEEESDESSFWLEIIIERGYFPECRVLPLLTESNEITAIMVSSLKTLKIQNPKS